MEMISNNYKDLSNAVVNAWNKRTDSQLSLSINKGVLQ